VQPPSPQVEPAGLALEGPGAGGLGAEVSLGLSEPQEHATAVELEREAPTPAAAQPSVAIARGLVGGRREEGAEVVPSSKGGSAAAVSGVIPPGTAGVPCSATRSSQGDACSRQA
jgi:hypothetical protein